MQNVPGNQWRRLLDDGIPLALSQAVAALGLDLALSVVEYWPEAEEVDCRLGDELEKLAVVQVKNRINEPSIGRERVAFFIIRVMLTARVANLSGSLPVGWRW